jgi:amino acid transporter
MTITRLRRSVTWRSSVVITLGAALLVTVSLGPMAGELGSLSPFVWLTIALIGALQCWLIAELAKAFPDRAGGTAMYAHAVLGRRAPLAAAISSWGYWFAWTPGIAVNLILAATYLKATVWHGVAVLPLAIAIGAALYCLNGFGLRPSMRAASCLAMIAVVPLAIILVGALTQPSLVDLGNLVPALPDGRSWTSPEDWLLVAKWAFVAAWSAYGAEMASTVVAEMRGADEHISRALLIAALLGLFAFGLLPFLMLSLVDAGQLSADPLVAFLPVAEAVLGDAGGTIVGVMLASALILGAQAFIVGSSRAIYQMTCDGYMPRRLAAVNRRNVPIGSLLLDATVIVALLLLFDTRVVDVVAAANVGYLVVFVLMPATFVALRVRDRGRSALRSPLAVAALGLMAVNSLLLVAGGLQWGGRVMLTGVVVMSLIVPISLLRRWQDRHAGRMEMLPFPGGQPLDEAY